MCNYMLLYLLTPVGLFSFLIDMAGVSIVDHALMKGAIEIDFVRIWQVLI